MRNKFMKDKVAVITGGAKGIGLAIAERFTDDGAKVVINDIDAEGSNAAKRLNGLFVEGDLSKREVCKTIIERTIGEFGTVHILVNNAGFQSIHSIDEFPEDTWDKMLAVMLTAPFLLTRYVWQYMKEQKWGRIINIASNSAFKAETNKCAYISAKHGLLGLTRTIAVEGGPYGITAHPICPALVRTSLIEKQIPDQARKRGIPQSEIVEKVFLKSAPIKRYIEPAEIAGLASFLCSDIASAMSGSPILIDLGKTAGHL